LWLCATAVCGVLFWLGAPLLPRGAGQRPVAEFAHAAQPPHWC